MNPSSSSNADPAPGAVFKVGTRQLSTDLSGAGSEHAARELGQLSETQLLAILQQLAQLPPEQSIDADPHLVIAARRGRFLGRASHGNIRLFDAADAGRAFLEIAPADVAAYLDGADPKPIGEAAAEPPIEVFRAPKPRTGLIVALALLTAGMLGGSAYFTFRGTSLDPDSEYVAVPAEQLTALRQQIVGTYATGKGDDARVLTLSAAGTVRFVESGPNNTVADEREDIFKLALHEGQVPTARAPWLGPIEVRDAKTLFYAGESYTRQP